MVMENSYKVIISQKTSQMLVSHVAYLAQVNPGAAKHLVAEFEKKANSLSFMPLMCPWLSGEYIPSHKYRYLLFEKRYMLIYQIIDDIVYVDYVIDTHQDYEWLIR